MKRLLLAGIMLMLLSGCRVEQSQQPITIETRTNTLIDAETYETVEWFPTGPYSWESQLNEDYTGKIVKKLGSYSWYIYMINDYHYKKHGGSPTFFGANRGVITGYCEIVGTVETKNGEDQ